MLLLSKLSYFSSILIPCKQTYNSTLKLLIRNRSNVALDNRRYVVVRVTPNDYPSVMDLFWNSYFVTEPTVVAAGLSNTHSIVFENNIMEGLSQGMSLMVKCRSDGAVVGAAINTALCPWNPDLLDKFANTCSSQRMSDLMHFYAYITRAPNLWKRFCVPKIFEVTYLTTRIDDRGMGIGLALLKKSLELGKDLTYNVIRVDATSVYTQNICEKLKLKQVYEIPYDSYRGEDGKVLFRAPPPHTSVKIYIHLPHSKETK